MLTLATSCLGHPSILDGVHCGVSGGGLIIGTGKDPKPPFEAATAVPLIYYHIYTYTHIHTLRHTHAHSHTHTHIRTRTQTLTHVHTYTVSAMSEDAH